MTEVNHENNFALIAIVRTLHESGNDSWTAFAQLALRVISDDQNIEEFLREFYLAYKVELPVDVAYTIIARLKKKNLVIYDSKKGPFRLSKQGRENISKSSGSSQKFRQEFEALIEDLTNYLTDGGVKVSNVEKTLINFIDSNLAFTASVASGSKEAVSSKIKVEIATYIATLESRNSALFKILQNIFFGRLYLQTFNKSTPIEQNAKFNNLSIYLDTNIVFSAIGITDDEHEGSSINNLIKALSANEKIKIKVLDITIEEAKRTLLANAKPSNKLPEYKVNDLSWKLQNQGYDPLTIATLTENLVERLNNLGITEERINVESNDYSLKSVRALSEAFNQNKSNNAIEHDASVLTFMTQARKGVHTGLLEKAKVLFLTTDNALISGSKKESQSDKSFPVSMSPVELTCLVWLKNMGAKDLVEALLRQALMVYAREKMLEGGLWGSFVEKLSSAKKQGHVTDSDIALIINSQQTKTLLFEEGDNAIEQVISQGYISSLKDKQSALESAAAHGRETSSRIANKKARISKTLALIIYISCSLFVSALLSFLIFFIVKWLGLDTFANLLAVAVPLIFLLIILNFGYAFRTNIISEYRSKIILSLEIKISKLLEKILY